MQGSEYNSDSIKNNSKGDVKMNTYHHLFSPIKVGHTTIKNRVFMPPISTNLADKGYITDELIQHYEARAKGGVGLIVTE